MTLLSSSLSISLHYLYCYFYILLYYFAFCIVDLHSVVFLCIILYCSFYILLLLTLHCHELDDIVYLHYVYFIFYSLFYSL